MNSFLEENSEIIKHIKKLTKSLQGSFSTQKEVVTSATSSLNIFEKEFEMNFSNREREFRELSHISRDIKDNFAFTVSIVDDLKSIQKFVSQIDDIVFSISVEAEKFEENQKVSNGSKKIRELSDEVKGSLEKIFTKEIRNKTFSEHNRYVRNSVVHRIDDELESLQKYIDSREEQQKRVSKLASSFGNLEDALSQNSAIISGIDQLTDAFTFNGEKDIYETGEIKKEVKTETRKEEKVEVIESGENEKAEFKRREIDRKMTIEDF
jgi:hypothetical protein